jgi:thiol-disulfide isomerase/thioredoxin
MLMAKKNLSKIYNVQKTMNGMSLRITNNICGLILLFCLLSTAVFAQKDKKPFNVDAFLKQKDSLYRTLIGTAYPNFEHFGDDSIVYSNKKLLGKKYYINFWFEGCHPCMDEMDTLVALKTKLKNTNNEFISFTWDIPATIKRVRAERKLNFIIIPVTMNDCSRLNFESGYPQHIVVDEKGMIVYISSVFNTREQTFKEITSLLLNKNTTQ